MQILVGCLLVGEFHVWSIPLELLSEAYGNISQQRGLVQKTAVLYKIGTDRRPTSTRIDPLLVLTGRPG